MVASSHQAFPSFQGTPTANQDSFKGTFSFQKLPGRNMDQTE